MLALVYQLFAVLAGWLEAILYAKRGAESFSSNEHTGMTYQRIAVLLVGGAAVLVFRWHGIWLLLWEVIPTALLFPLCHDESYNLTRLWLSYTEKLGFTDWQALRLAWREYRYGYQSPTTTARNDFNGRARTWLAVAGGVVLAALYSGPTTARHTAAAGSPTGKALASHHTGRPSQCTAAPPTPSSSSTESQYPAQ